MRTRNIILMLVTITALLTIGAPQHARILHADEGPTYPIVIWFPYVCNIGDYDTGIVVQGNANLLPPGVDPWIRVEYYDADGVHQATITPSVQKATNTQWVALLSSIYGGGEGSLLVLTNIPDAKGQGFLCDFNGYQTIACIPALNNYPVASVDEGGGVTMKEGFERLWYGDFDPDTPGVDPSRYYTTMCFPFVVNESGWDTGFTISGLCYGAWTADLYIYNKTGQLSRKVRIHMDGESGGAVAPMYCNAFSQVATEAFYNIAHCDAYASQQYTPFCGEGYMLAVVETPYAYGCSFPNYNPYGIGCISGVDAVINNNIYGVDEGHEPLRIVEPTGGTTAIVMPLIVHLDTPRYDTVVTLTNPVPPQEYPQGFGSVDFYLYNMDGSPVTGTNFDGHWSTALNYWHTGETARIVFDDNGIQMARGHDVTAQTVCSDNINFTGWMLIIFHGADAYATGNVYSDSSQLGSYVGVNDPDITGVDENGIVRQNMEFYPLPPPPTHWHLPYFVTAYGWDTAVLTVMPYSRYYGVGNLYYDYQGYSGNSSLEYWDPKWVHDGFPHWPVNASGPLSLTGNASFGGNLGCLDAVVSGCPPGNINPIGVAWYYVAESSGEIEIHLVQGEQGGTPNPSPPPPPVILNPPTYLPVGATVTLDGSPGVTWSITNNNGDPATAATLENLGDSGGKSHVRLSTGPNLSVAVGDLTIRVSNSAGHHDYPLTIYRMHLKYVTYYAQNNTDCHEVWKDDSSGPYAPYPAPQWHDASDPLDGDADDPGDEKYPICYTRNTKPKAAVQIVAEPAAAFPNPKIIGEGSDNIEFPYTAAAVVGNTFTVSGVESNTTLPNTVKYYESFDINWNLSPDGGTTYCYAGTSDNPLCVTYDTPLTFVVPDPPAPPVIDNRLLASHIIWSCSKADSKNSKETVANAIWDAVKAETDFGGKGNWAWDLLNPGTSGDCFQQASLMQCAVTLLGIYADVRYVRASTDAGEGNCLDLETRVVNGRTQYLFMYFLAADPEYRWNAGEGCCILYDVVEGNEQPWKFYAITPSEKQDNDYAILTAIHPQQFWVTLKRKVDQEWVPCGPEDDGAIIEEVFEEEAIP